MRASISLYKFFCRPSEGFIIAAVYAFSARRQARTEGLALLRSQW
jgi:hypothetical protein